ncbi:MAG: phytanoyl-CoA dioxygenase [Litorimonas sp.]
MTQSNLITDFKTSSKALLREDLPHEDAVEIINRLHHHFYDLTDISGNDMVIQNLAAVPTASGMALGLNHAAQCLLDYHRTIKILQGLFKVIKDRQSECPGETINIFYAGCGPYAPFVPMIASQFNPEDLQFSLLEINKPSLDSAKRLIKGLSLEAYIKDYHLADAVTFEIPDAASFHILYSETLDALLFRECYVPILANMLPQLRDTVTLIPNNVVLTAELFSNDENTANEKSETVTIFDTRETLTTLNAPLPNIIPAAQIALKAKDTRAMSRLIIDTHVDIYDGIALTRGQSSLTLPYEMHIAPDTEFETLEFHYQLKPSIELIQRFSK